MFPTTFVALIALNHLCLTQLEPAMPFFQDLPSIQTPFNVKLTSMVVVEDHQVIF